MFTTPHFYIFESFHGIEKKQSWGCLIPMLYPETNIILYVTTVTEKEIFFN